MVLLRALSLASVVLLVSVVYAHTGSVGIDVSQDLGATAWTCLAKSTPPVEWAVVRAWHSYGAFDSNAPATLKAATAAGPDELAFAFSLTGVPHCIAGIKTVDAYMFPCRGKDAGQQIQQLIQSLNGSDFTTVPKLIPNALALITILCGDRSGLTLRPTRATTAAGARTSNPTAST